MLTIINTVIFFQAPSM